MLHTWFGLYLAGDSSPSAVTASDASRQRQRLPVGLQHPVVNLCSGELSSEASCCMSLVGGGEGTVVTTLKEFCRIQGK